MNIKVINVLKVDDNEFRCGDIVEVGIGTFDSEVNRFSNEYEGSISAIGNSCLMIDSSEKYETNVHQILYEKIKKIEKVDEPI